MSQVQAPPEAGASQAADRQGRTKESDLTVQVHNFFTQQAQFRMDQQSRCISLSLQVTSGLAVLFAAFISLAAKPDKPQSFEEILKKWNWPVLATACLYALIQLCILANYHFQTLFVHYNALMYGALRKKAGFAAPAPDPPPAAARSLGCRLWSVERFQPLILYASFLAGCCATGLALLLLFGSWFWCALTALSAATTSGMLYLLHCRSIPLAKLYAGRASEGPPSP